MVAVIIVGLGGLALVFQKISEGDYLIATLVAMVVGIFCWAVLH